MDKIIDLGKIKVSFQDILETQSLGDDECSVFQQNIEKLDLYLKKLNLSGVKSKGENKPNIGLLMDIGYYLLSYLTNPIGDAFIEHISIFKKDGLNIGGLIFEFLFKYTELEDEYDNKKIDLINYLFYSSVCYSLAGKEANAIFIARKLEDFVRDDVLFLIVSKILQRNFKGIINQSEVIESLKGKGLINHIVKVLYDNAILFVEGVDNKLQLEENINLLIPIKDNLINQSNTQLLFIVSKIEEVLREMINNSVWSVLLELGLPKDYILSLTKYSENNFYELWEGQRNIIKNILGSHENRVFVNMPTSGGKSFIAELTIIDLLERNPEKKVVYIVPTNALANQVEEDLFYKFRTLGYSVSNTIDLGDDIESINENIIILTPEKLDLIIRRDINFIDAVGLFIFDEFHKIQDGERGLLLETLITFLMLKQEKESQDFRILTISAIVDDLVNINKWFGNNNGIFQSNWSPSRKLYGILKRGFHVSATRSETPFDLVFRYQSIVGEVTNVMKIITRNNKKGEVIPPENIAIITSLAKEIYSKDKSPILIYFLNKKTGLYSYITTSNFNKYWTQFGELFITTDDQRDKIDLLVKYLQLRLSDEHPLTKLAKYGIGIHSGDLPKDVRNEIELAYKNGIIKLLLSTSTLSDGVNLPIKNLIFHNTFGLDIGDFKNIAGRVGRATKETEGNIYFISKDRGLIERSKEGLSISSYLDNYGKLESGEYYDFLDYVLGFEESERLKYLENFNRVQVFIFSVYEYLRKNDPDITLTGIQNNISKTLYLAKKEPEKISIFHELNRLNYGSVQDLYENNPEILSVINKTGLSNQSFSKLNELVGNIYEKYLVSDQFEMKHDNFEAIISTQVYNELIKIHEFGKVISGNKFESLDNYNILLCWIEGSSFIEIRDTFFTHESDISNRTSRAVGYLSTMFEYVLPWAFSSLSIISENLYRFPQDILNEIKLSPLKVKHGVKTNYGVELVKLGIEYHELLVSLERLYMEEKTSFDQDESQDILFMDIKQWLLDYSFYKLEIKVPILRNNTSYIRNIGKVKNKIRERTYLLEEMGFLEFEIRGIFNNELSRNLDKVVSRYKLSFQRDYNNIYDIFAVKIKYESQTLGYVPSEYSEEISDYLKRGIKLTIIDVANKGISIKINISLS